MKDKKADVYYCPLLDKEIEQGLCIDINYERLKYFKAGILKEIQKTEQAANKACEKCPKKPV